MEPEIERNYRRLERALRLYLNWLSAERPGSKADLLARNEDVAEFLEPMLTQVRVPKTGMSVGRSRNELRLSDL